MHKETSVVSTSIIINLYVAGRRQPILDIAVLETADVVLLAPRVRTPHPASATARVEPPLASIKAWLIAQPKSTSAKAEAITLGSASCRCDEETFDFAERRGLKGHLIDYTKKATEHFRITRTPTCRLAHDHENDDEYLLLEIHVAGAVREVLDAEDGFRDSVLASIPGDDLYLIRLSYYID